ncbi:radical SAM protein [Candidatus Uhrbacteria bacterium]|nr:radical SAM protein [Candidatus Uhrbacteria bacterium]
MPMLSPATAVTATVDRVTEVRASFPELLQLICDIQGRFWIRFLTSHPYDMSDELIEVVARNPKMCKYIHLPVQAGSDVVLKKMNRHYSVEHYVQLMKKVRERLPQASISTDIIVGFCGETEEQFGATAYLMEELEYDMAYIAQYSPREGTVAAKSFSDDVLPEEKVRRDKVINTILARTALKHHQKYIGRQVDVLVDSVEPCGEGLFSNFGKTETFKTTKFVSAREWKGEFVPVRIKAVTSWGLEGEMV